MLGKVILLAAAGVASALELTPDTWDKETAGKTVFIKFLAPWWGHCKSMKPAWDKLIESFAGSPSALVADVDCTAAGQPLCEKVGVSGYPTIKWGDPSDLKDYQGGRDFDSLKKFADENLGPSCGPENLDLCDAKDKAKYEKFMEMSADRLDQKVVAAIRIYEKEVPMMKKVSAYLKKKKSEL